MLPFDDNKGRSVSAVTKEQIPAVQNTTILYGHVGVTKPRYCCVYHDVTDP
jgi:hypothetical protein